MAVRTDHDCELVAVVEGQAKQIQELLELARAQGASLEKASREIEQLKKALIGPKTERMKMPSVAEELGGAPVSAEDRLARRRARAAVRAQIQTLRVEHKVPPEQRTCAKCGNDKLTELGKDGVVTTVIEYVPAQLVRVEHVQEKLRCKCGEHVVTAPGAPKVIEQGRYGASFIAHLITAKCVDSIPIYRIEKDFKRQGLPISRSTMTDVFHGGAGALAPIADLLLDGIRRRDVVLADETRTRLLQDADGTPRNGFYWTFLADDEDGEPDVAFRFAATRSGDTPREILGGTTGALLVDAYSGYNEVTGVEGRERAACHAHLRRYFHEALRTAPVAREAINLILDLYRVEHEAKARGIVGETSHFELRQTKSRAARDRLKVWLDTNLALHPPKSPIGVAIRYGLNHWTELGRFIDNVKIPIDNNASERALRRVALGRKNFLFVGNVDAGQNIAGLYSLVATCEARGINPYAYLTDVLTRVGDHLMNDNYQCRSTTITGAGFAALTA